MYLKCDLRKYDLNDLGSKFDVILVEPPLEEYQRTNGVNNVEFYPWEEIMKIKIEDVAAPRSFIFLWCGSSDGLDLGRQCLRKWGFRRCEDICWIKTNVNQNKKHTKNLDPNAIFQRTKEHCLMGIKGTVRRSTDGDFIHANIDIDLIITEEFDYGSLKKPDEIFHIIEHFCLGRRRLNIFGRDDIIRPGWLSVGPALTNSNFNAETYSSYFSGMNGHLTGCTERIETLRPKSPPPKPLKNSNSARSGSHYSLSRKIPRSWFIELLYKKFWVKCLFSQPAGAASKSTSLEQFSITLLDDKWWLMIGTLCFDQGWGRLARCVTQLSPPGTGNPPPRWQLDFALWILMGNHPTFHSVMTLFDFIRTLFGTAIFENVFLTAETVLNVSDAYNSIGKLT